MHVKGFVVLAVMTIVSSNAGAQGVPFSQHGTVSQRVSHTDISIEYNRPVARGRTLFGALVKWDTLWHPGADSATRISFSKDVTFQGSPLPRGEYSVWLIPRESAPWTLVLSSAARVFHSPYPGAEADVLRVDVQPERGGHMETLAYYFPVVGRDSTVLRIHWGETVLPVHIRVSRDP
ncbi:MAG TPA: DUF2911 domain-containing protein [Gemmatimonadaceae bacterium]